MLVLSESAWGDPRASPCSATYRTLGFSLDAMETARGGGAYEFLDPGPSLEKMEDFYY